MSRPYDSVASLKTFVVTLNKSDLLGALNSLDLLKLKLVSGFLRISLSFSLASFLRALTFPVNISSVRPDISPVSKLVLKAFKASQTSLPVFIEVTCFGERILFHMLIILPCIVLSISTLVRDPYSSKATIFSSAIVSIFMVPSAYLLFTPAITSAAPLKLFSM